MGTIKFSDYIASRPAANTPVGASDRLLILQDGAVKLVASDDTGRGVETVLIDATLTPTTSLPASGEIVYKKSDDSATVCAFAVSVEGQIMCQELIDGLSVQGEVLRVKLIVDTWYKIG